MRGFTVLLNALMEHFDTNLTMIQLAFNSMILSGVSVGGFISALIIPKFGARRPLVICACMIVTGWGLTAVVMQTINHIYAVAFLQFFLIGLPSGVGMLACMGSIKENGGNHMGMAISLMYGGASSGSFLLPLIFEYLNTSFGIIYTMYGIAVGSILLVLSSFFLPEKKSYLKKLQQEQEIKLNPDAKVEKLEKPKLISIKLLKDKIYMNYIWGKILFLCGYFALVTVLRDVFLSFGMENSTVLMLLTIMGITECISRLIFAFFLIDRVDKMSLMLTAFTLDALGMSTLLLCTPINSSLYSIGADNGQNLTVVQSMSEVEGYTKNYWILLFVCTFGGFWNAGFGSLMGAVGFIILPRKDYSVGNGMSTLAIFLNFEN